MKGEIMKTMTIEIDLKLKTYDGQEITQNAGATIHTDDPFYSILLDYYKECLEDITTALALISSDPDNVAKLFEFAMDKIECTTCNHKTVAE